MTNADLWEQTQADLNLDRLLEDLDAARQSRWEDFFCWAAWITLGVIVVAVWVLCFWLIRKVVSA